MATNVNWKELTKEELDAYLTAARTETERRNTIAYAEIQSSQLAEEYANAVKGNPPMDGSTVPSTGWGPGQKVNFGGKVFTNISGGWLVHNPTEYAQGWKTENAGTPNPTTPIPWVVNLVVKKGDLVTHNNKTWICITGHTTQVDWAPGVAHTLWKEKVN